VPRLSEELRVLHGNGGFTKWLLQVARVDVLLLDDWGMAPLDAMVRNDLLEMIDDRSGSKATIVTSQILRSRTRKAEGFLVSDCGYEPVSECL
jgi:DNA replication protein DnaC